MATSQCPLPSPHFQMSIDGYEEMLAGESATRRRGWGSGPWLSERHLREPSPPSLSQRSSPPFCVLVWALATADLHTRFCDSFLFVCNLLCFSDGTVLPHTHTHTHTHTQTHTHVCLCVCVPLYFVDRAQAERAAQNFQKSAEGDHCLLRMLHIAAGGFAYEI